MLNHWFTKCVPWRRPAKLDTHWFLPLKKCGCQLHTEDSYLLGFESSGIRITGADGHLDRRSLWPYWGGGSNYLSYLSSPANIPFSHPLHRRGVPMDGFFCWQCCLHHLRQVQRLPWMQVWYKILCWEHDAHKKEQLHGCELGQWFHAVW